MIAGAEGLWGLVCSFPVCWQPGGAASGLLLSVNQFFM